MERSVAWGRMHGNRSPKMHRHTNGKCKDLVLRSGGETTLSPKVLGLKNQLGGFVAEQFIINGWSDKWAG